MQTFAFFGQATSTEHYTIYRSAISLTENYNDQEYRKLVASCSIPQQAWEEYYHSLHSIVIPSSECLEVGMQSHMLYMYGQDDYNDHKRYTTSVC